MHLPTGSLAPGEHSLVPAFPRCSEAPPRTRHGSVRSALLWLAAAIAALGVLLYFYVYSEVPGPDDLRAGAQPADHPAAVDPVPPGASPPAAPVEAASEAPRPAPAQAEQQAGPPVEASPTPEAALSPGSPSAAANRFAGVWKVSAPPIAPKASDAEKLAADFASAFVPDGLSLDLRTDGTFTGTVLVPMEGAWSSDGSTCTLNASRWNGMTAPEYDRAWEGGAPGPRRNSEPIRLRISDDGKRLTPLHDDGTLEGHYAYVRVNGG